MKKISLLILFIISVSFAFAQEDSTRAKELGEVVITTGQYRPQSLKNSVYKVRVITQEKISMRGATDVLSVLNTELGVRFGTDYTLGETDIQLMGMSGQNVKILLDGVPLVDRGSTRQSLSQVDINTIERIELVEGPMSVVYGTDALAGVINLITKKNVAKGRNSIQVNARVQEETVESAYEPFKGEGVHNEYIGLAWQHQSGWSAGGSFTRNDFGGWQGTKTGREMEWKPKVQYLGSGNIGFRKNNLNVWYRLDYLDEKITTKGAAQSDNKAADAQYITNRYTHTAQADWRVNSKWSLNASASYQDYQRRSRNTISDLSTGQEFLNPSATQDVAKFRMIFFRTTAQYILSDKVTLQPGIEVKSDQSSGERIHGEPQINDYSFFASAELKPARRLNIRPGVRFSKNSVYDAPPVIPSLNLKYDLSADWSLRASYARGFRAPALRELYFTFHDASHDIEGNPNLKAEHSNSYNASLSWHAIHKKDLQLNTSVSGFYNQFENQIAYATDPVNPTLTTLINIDHFKTTGALLENNLVWKNLEFSLGISYTGRYNSTKGDTTVDKGNTLSSFLWSPEVNSNVLYRFSRIGMTIGMFFKYTGQTPGYEIVTAPNTAPVLNKTKIEGFSLTDVTVTKKLGKLLGLNAGVKNLFDVTRLQNTSVSSGGAHSSSGPVLKSYGRSYFLGVQFNWQHNR
ncbi:MAG: TonB-dependent receptor [Citrobacter freundii]|nr:MAG: TonB-dependent receptor [Citrobacter freundii]